MSEVPRGDNVRQPGSDARKGEKVMDKGTVIGSGGGEVGLLGFVGKRQVSVIGASSFSWVMMIVTRSASTVGLLLPSCQRGTNW